MDCSLHSENIPSFKKMSSVIRDILQNVKVFLSQKKGQNSEKKGHNSKTMNFEWSPLIVWIALWIKNTFSEFKVIIFSKNRDITKCHSGKRGIVLTKMHSQLSPLKAKVALFNIYFKFQLQYNLYLDTTKGKY